jgi:DNA polymerase-3 subunit chi
MTRVSFYILGSALSTPIDEAQALNQYQSRLEFACRLTEKAVRSGKQTFIAVNNLEELEHLDELLWSFRPESFIPHNTPQTGQPPTLVTISHEEDCNDHHGLIINLRKSTPNHFSQFERLAEIVCQDPIILAETREHFSFYKQRGYPIETHTIN